MKEINKVLLWIPIFTILLAGIVFGAETNIDSITVPEVKYSHFKLDNGLETFVFEDHTVPLVEVSVWYKVGSLDEPEGLTGISHMLEHSMFLETKHLKKGQVFQLTKQAGGYANGDTRYNLTKYYEKVPAANLELAIAMEANRMRYMKISPSEFKREREVVIQERRRGIESDTIRSAYEEIVAKAFITSPLHHQVIGWSKDLQGLTVEQVNDYYHHYYTPNNAVVAVSGDVSPQKAQQLVTEYFGNYRPQPVERIKTFEAEQTEERTVTIEKATQVPYLVMIYKIPAGNHPDTVAIQVLLNILINNDNSRINQELKQKRQLLLGSGSWTTFYLPVPGYAQVVLVPVSVDKMAEVQREFESELNRIIEKGITDEELQTIKKSMIKDLVFMQREPNNFVEYVIQGAMNFQDPDYYQKVFASLRELSKEDVIRAAKRYFIKEHRTVGYIVPQKSKS